MDCQCQKTPWWVRHLFKAVDLVLVIGLVLAMLTSWEKYHSKGYTIFAAFANWLYVLFPNFYDNAWMK